MVSMGLTSADQNRIIEYLTIDIV